MCAKMEAEEHGKEEQQRAKDQQCKLGTRLQMEYQNADHGKNTTCQSKRSIAKNLHNLRLLSEYKSTQAQPSRKEKRQKNSHIGKK